MIGYSYSTAGDKAGWRLPIEVTILNYLRGHDRKDSHS